MRHVLRPVSLLVLLACAGCGGRRRAVHAAAPASGLQETLPLPASEVLALAQRATTESGWKTRDTKPRSEGGWEVRIEQPASMRHWGQRGLMLIIPKGDKATTVRVFTERKVQGNATANPESTQRNLLLEIERLAFQSLTAGAP